MKIMEIAPLQTCKCGSALDEYGDRCLGSTASHKTCASNSIRDGLVRIFKHVLQTAKLIGSPIQVESEVQNIVPTLPKLKPFDLSFCLDQSLDSGSWRMPYSCIGFNVTLVHATKPSISSESEAAQYHESD
jgi:hypothetical protein